MSTKEATSHIHEFNQNDLVKSASILREFVDGTPSSWDNFVKAAAEPASAIKISNGIASYVSMKMREEMFTDIVLPPVKVLPNELIPMQDEDKVYFMVERDDTETEAYWTPFEAGSVGEINPTSRRLPIPMEKIKIKTIRKEKTDLYAYKMDLMSLIDKAIFDAIRAVVDSGFLTIAGQIISQHSENAVTLSGGTLEKQHIVALKKKMADFRIDPIPSNVPKAEDSTPACLLFNRSRFYDVENWDPDSVGDDITKELFINGYSWPTFMGLRFAKSFDAPKDKIWLFGPPKYLGVNAILDDLTVTVRVEADTLIIDAWMVRGLGIVNTKPVIEGTLT